MSLLRGELSLNLNENVVKQKQYKQHRFLAVSFQFTSYWMKKSIKNTMQQRAQKFHYITLKNTTVYHTNIPKDNRELS